MIIKTFDFSNDVFDLFHLFKQERQVFFLDSSLTTSSNGRYSFIGFDPFETIQGRDLKSFQSFKQRFFDLQKLNDSDRFPLNCGGVGYFSYDLGMLFQGLSNPRLTESSTPLFYFGLYDVVLTIDHLEQKLHVQSNGFPETEINARQKRAAHRLNVVVDRLESFLPTTHTAVVKKQSDQTPGSVYHSDSTREQYLAAIKRVLKHIDDGDIYQINLSHKVVMDNKCMPKDIKAWEIYEQLRGLSPSHFSAYFDAGDHQILSTSPERFLCLKDGLAQVKPMKGTRPRGVTPEQDSVLRQDLLHSAKEIAELLMVTDLERNDLGRVCEIGSVKVKELRTIEEYRTVFQATSTIEGQLMKNKTCFDLIEACFPGGSVTGCPKISAMRIIDDIERSSRGIYTGAFGYIDFSGNLDFNILIRTILLSQENVSFHVGGGIVADSNPAMEYDETWLKASAMIECLDACRNRRDQ